MRSLIFTLTMLVCISALAQTQGEEIQKHIRTIRTNGSIEAKQQANSALAEIGFPALNPVMDFLHEVCAAKPGDNVWISPGYVRDAITAICKHVGDPAEKRILQRYVTAKNQKESELLFHSLADAATYPKTLMHLLELLKDQNKMTHRVRWGVTQVVNMYLYQFGRDEIAVTGILGILQKHPDLAKQYVDIARCVRTLETVGVPQKDLTYSPVNENILNITADEQTEFFVALPKPDGPWGYKWSFGKDFRVDLKKQDVVKSFGRTVGKDKCFFRFIGSKPEQIQLNVYVLGGVWPENPKPTYRMLIKIRKLPPAQREEKLEALRKSLDERKQEYAKKFVSGETKEKDVEPKDALDKK